jgi:hypothetical protein
MRKSFKSVVAGVLTLCVAGAISALGATSASAAAGPFDPDVNAFGTITLYDFNGNVITSGDANAYGSATNPTGLSYAVASVPSTGNTSSRAHISLYNPQVASPVNTAAWSGVQLNANTIYPLATAPAPINASLNAATPMPVGTQTLTSAVTAFAPNTAAGWVNLYQLRLANVTGLTYAATTISIDPTTHLWQQTYPVVADSTTTVLTQSATSPAAAPASDTLTATVNRTAATSSKPVGSVQFKDGANNVGSPVAVNATTGVATLAQPAVPAGTYSYTAVFTPTDPAVFMTSTSSALPLVVASIPVGPSLALTVDNAAPNTGVTVNFTSTQTSTPVNTAGNIQLFDGLNALGTAAPAAASNTFAVSFATAGVHHVTAKFVPTDPTLFTSTTSPVVDVTATTVATPDCLLTGSSCTDAQSFTVNVPAGSIVISTPYSALNQFNMGAMALDTAGSQYSASKAFGDAANPALGVTITDTRAGGKGWTASLQSSDFINGTSTINAGNLGFTGVTPRYLTNNLLGSTGHLVSVFDNAAPVTALGFPAAAPALSLATPQKFASTGIGAGSVNVTGLFTIVAPSSVPAGQYDGTVTFTII